MLSTSRSGTVQLKSRTQRIRTSSRRAVSLIAAVRDQSSKLVELTDPQLKSAAEDLQAIESRSPKERFARSLHAIALSIEAIRRTTGLAVYDVQVLAASSLSGGAITEMATGEGKTVVAAIAAVVQGIDGASVHVVTPNAYLAARDLEQFRSSFELLGLTAELLPEQVAPDLKKSAYESDITYGTGYEFGFDYLRDQVQLRSTGAQKLGDNLRNRLSHDGRHVSSMQRGRHAAIVDEADNVLLDDAGSPLILADVSTGTAIDEEVHLSARDLVDRLVVDVDFRISNATVELTDAGFERVHAPDENVPVRKLQRPWSEYVIQAIQARFLFRENIHYVIDEREIKIVDASTGRIFQDRTWKNGLHQAIEAREGLPISNYKNALAQVTRQRYFRYYRQLCGTTGTAVGCEREFRTVYRLPVQTIPLRLPSRRIVQPLRAFSSREAKWLAISKEIVRIHRTGQPILVGTSSIMESEFISQLLQSKVAFQLLNGRQNAEEAEIIARAGQLGAVTISTNLAGRGTDIKLGEEVKSVGGVHVIVAEPQESARIDRQLIGRCARQGDPGSCQMFVSVEDAIVMNFGAWLIKPTIRFADSSGEIQLNVTNQLRRMQRLSERSQYAARAALLRQDLARDVVFSRTFK